MPEQNETVTVPYAADHSSPREGDRYDREYVIQRIHWDEVSGYTGRVIVDLVCDPMPLWRVGRVSSTPATQPRARS
jgi:hypothetical protein